MNTEEVVEMIDAITDGKNYSYWWEGSSENFDNLKFASTERKFQLRSEEGGAFIFDCIDPRTAREIAGALVAWANRKDSKPDSQEAMEIADEEYEAPPRLQIVRSEDS